MAHKVWIVTFSNLIVRVAQCTCIAVVRSIKSPLFFVLKSRALCAVVPWQFSNRGEQLEVVLPQKLVQRGNMMSWSRRSRITTTTPYLNHWEQMMLNYLGRTVRFTASQWNTEWVQMRRKSVYSERKSQFTGAKTRRHRALDGIQRAQTIAYKDKIFPPCFKHFSHILSSNHILITAFIVVS